MRRFVHFAGRLGGISRRLGIFVFYLPLMIRVGSLSLWPRDGSRANTIARCDWQRRKHPFAPAPLLFLIDLQISDHAKVAELCEELTLLGYASPTLAKKHAFALWHLDRFQEAAAVLQAALDERNPDPWILECLGNCYFTLSEYSLAREAYRRCLDLPIAVEARGRIQDWVSQVEALLGFRRAESDGN